jgi:hypothetical protein
MKRQSRIVITVAFALLSIGIGAGPADAAAPGKVDMANSAKPRLAWQFQSADVDQGTPAVAMYQVAGLPAGSRVTLERAFGTAGVFRKVAASTKAVGSFTVTAPQMGQYTYRMTVRSKAGKKLTWGDQKLRAYRDVPLAEMLGQSTDTVQIGTTLFRWAAAGGTYKWQDTSCRRFAFNAARKDYNISSAKPGKVTIIQERGDPLELQVPVGTIVPGAIELAGGAWELQAGGSSYYTYIDGVANCWSTNGEAS